MSKAKAYSETHKENISLDDAHEFYFSQTGKRRRFVFRCGDPICREEKNPLVVGALYDREDKPGEKHRSPYFREHASHPHIENCTWIEELKKSSDTNTPKSTTPSSSDGWSVSTKGLIFDPAPSGSNSKDGNSESRDPRNGGNTVRPEKSRFIDVVASRYLAYTDTQRESISLSINKVGSGTFYSMCRPLHTFHPYYQTKHIYFGHIKVIDLNKVFILEFIRDTAPDGNKTNRIYKPQIVLAKNQLDEKDLSFKIVLQDIAKNKKISHCFFYSTSPPSTKTINGGDVARFDITDLRHIAVIPTIEVNNPNSDLQS